MTMRQVDGLLHVIGRADLVEFYNQTLSYSMVQGVKLPSLNEFLALTLSGHKNEPTSFDDKTDKAFEAQALKRLHERQKVNGQ